MPNAVVNIAGSATGEIAPGVTNKTIVVLGYVIGGSNSSVTFKTGSTAISGVMGITTAVSLAAPFCSCGWMTTVAGEALNITAGTGDVDGHLLYEYR